MTDEGKKIIVDDDWKAEAQREKQKLAAEIGEEAPGERLPASGLLEIANLLAMQAMAGLGLLAGPAGERIPPNPPMAKHFIDLLQTLDEKTRDTQSEEEKQALGQFLYEMRMQYIQMSGAGMPRPPGPTAK